MDVLTSSEFRRRYASLIVPTRVTVNGHAIGTWVPVVADPIDAGTGRSVVSEAVEPSYPQFRPVPKPGRK